MYFPISCLHDLDLLRANCIISYLHWSCRLLGELVKCQSIFTCIMSSLVKRLQIQNIQRMCPCKKYIGRHWADLCPQNFYWAYFPSILERIDFVNKADNSLQILLRECYLLWFLGKCWFDKQSCFYNDLSLQNIYLIVYLWRLYAISETEDGRKTSKY